MTPTAWANCADETTSWTECPDESTDWSAGTLLFLQRSDGFEDLVTDTLGLTFSLRSDGFLDLNRNHSALDAHVISERADGFIDIAAP